MLSDNMKTKMANVENMNSAELCDFLRECFDALESARKSILPIIELVCARIIACEEYDETRLTTIFAEYSKLIFNVILPNLNQCNVESLILLIKHNYSKLNRNSSTLSIQTKAELLEEMSLNMSCDFLKECFESFEQSSSDTKSLAIPIIESVCARIIAFSDSEEEQMTTIFEEHATLIANEILSNWEQEDIENLHLLLTRNYARILFDFPTLSVRTKTSLIANMDLNESCSFLEDCFPVFLESPASTKGVIVSMIECVSIMIIDYSDCSEIQLTTIFVKYSDLIADEILPCWEECEIKCFLVLLARNHPTILDFTTISIETKAELIEDMSLNVSCDFLKECFESFKQSSSDTRNLTIPIIESVCGRIIACSDSEEEKVTIIFEEYATLIAEEILSNWEQDDIENLHFLLTKNYARILFNFPSLSVRTKTSIIANMDLNESCNFLEDCFPVFLQNSSSTKGVIVSMIECACRMIIDDPDCSEIQLTTIFVEYSEVIADEILLNWEQCEIKCFLVLLAWNYPMILDFSTISVETRNAIVENIKPPALCDFLDAYIHLFGKSENQREENCILSIIESICNRIIDCSPLLAFGSLSLSIVDSDMVENLTTIFAQNSKLIVNEILFEYDQPEVESLYILLAKSYPRIILDYPTLSVQKQMAIVEKMEPTELCGFMDDFFCTFDKFFKHAKNSIVPIIESVCSRIIDQQLDETMIETFEEYSKLITDEILRNFDQCDVKNLQLLLKKFSMLSVTTKLANLQQKLKKNSNTRIELTIDRKNVLNSSYIATSLLTPEQWMSSFKITFHDEAGVDVGGLLREWFTVTTREILNPDYGLFTTAPGDVNCYMINKSSYINEDHLKYFTFFGRFLAKGIVEGKQINCHFTKALYKHILGVPVEYSDFRSEDPTYFKSLDFLINNPVQDSGLELTFVVEIDEFGVLQEKELIPHGKNIEVTDDNKNLYVTLVSSMKMTVSIQPQLNAFLGGFYDIIPKNEIQKFNENELEMIICGPSEIDIDDLKANTTYQSYQESDYVIQWFWKALRSYDKDDKAKFLMFTTGSFKAPLNGFSTLQGDDGVRTFSINRDGVGNNRLPKSHTCFNQLDLPQYESYEKLREKLLLAIREGTEGFGIV